MAAVTKSSGRGQERRRSPNRTTGTAGTSEPRLVPERKAWYRWPARAVLPGGRWSWWAWTLYLLLIGPLLLLAAIPAAVLRLVSPHPARVWVFERRRAAAGYVVSALSVVLALAVTLAFGGAGAGPVASEAGATAGANAAGPAELADANPGEASQPPAAPALPEATAPAASAGPTVVVTPAATAAPAATRRVVVADTGGLGVSLRRSARWADRWPGAAWGEGAILVVLEEGITGDDGAGGTVPWLRVRDPASREGFIPARYARPTA